MAPADLALLLSLLIWLALAIRLFQRTAIKSGGLVTTSPKESPRMNEWVCEAPRQQGALTASESSEFENSVTKDYACRCGASLLPYF